MILSQAPLAPDAMALIALGVREIEFPHANEALVAAYADSLAEAREMLVSAGVQFAVSGLLGDF
jgi:hypothetical protein